MGPKVLAIVPQSSSAISILSLPFDNGSVLNLAASLVFNSSASVRSYLYYSKPPNLLALYCYNILNSWAFFYCHSEDGILGAT